MLVIGGKSKAAISKITVENRIESQAIFNFLQAELHGNWCYQQPSKL